LPKIAEPNHSPSHTPNKSKPSTQQTKHEVLDPGSLTASEIEDDNAYFYGEDSPVPSTPAAEFSRTETRGLDGKQTFSSQHHSTYNVDVYTFSKLPGSAGGTIITCPNDVAVRSWTENGVEFGVKKLDLWWGAAPLGGH